MPKTNRQKLTTTWMGMILSLVVWGGCDTIENLPVSPLRPDDILTEADIEKFLALVGRLPEGRAPALPPIFPPAPQWSRDRLLPVHELVQQEESFLSERTTTEYLTLRCPRSPQLDRVLKKHQMSIEQFIGLYISVAVSSARDSVPADRDLEQIAKRGITAVAKLKQDRRKFSSLTDDEAYDLLGQARWLTVLNRAQRLRAVRTENSELVHAHRDKLAKVLPPEYLRNPFLDFGKTIDEQDIPFQEHPARPSDANIPWSPESAIVGGKFSASENDK
jgi:hypothetical protein